MSPLRSHLPGDEVRHLTAVNGPDEPMRDFVDRFVQAVRAELPGALVRWEDFATPNALPHPGALPRPAAHIQR